MQPGWQSNNLLQRWHNGDVTNIHRCNFKVGITYVQCLCQVLDMIMNLV